MRNGKRYNPSRALHIALKSADETTVSAERRRQEIDALAAFKAVKVLPPVVTRDLERSPAFMFKVVGEAV